MIPVRYVWLAWSALFFCVWVGLFAGWRRYRMLMWWSSIIALPFGCFEPFFLMNYWHPPSLLDLSYTIHADLETFLFCFSIGGTAAAGYHIVTGRAVNLPTMTSPGVQRLVWYCAALLAPIPAFLVTLLLTVEIIWAGIAGFAAGVCGRLLSRPDLAMKTCVGGPLFLGYYTVMLLLLTCMAPGYLDLAWNMDGPASARIFRLPVTELLFGLAFGLYWSGLFEQLAWLFPPLVAPNSTRSP